MDSINWAEYYDAIAEQPARKTLLAALEHWEEQRPNKPGAAIDLGCGSGRDTFELIRRGWSVLAIDREPEAIRRLKQHLPAQPTPLLSTRKAELEGLELPGCDLINASFSLPFCRPQHFPSLWQSLRAALRPSGLLTGQLFGDRDTWASDPKMTFHTRAEVEQLLDGLATVAIKEIEEDGKTAIGTEKHWHYYSFVAQAPTQRGLTT